jgi:membrane protein YdbS with pleckstrin-like domain
MKVISPSQWTNLPWFIISAIAIWLEVYWLLIFPVGVMYYTYKWLYQFSNNGIVETKGIFSVSHRELQYFRIKSVKLDEPLWMRFFGISNVTILSSDPYLPELQLYGIKNGKHIHQELRDIADQHRDRKGVKEYDLYNLNK